jgi:hypothetical protein
LEAERDAIEQRCDEPEDYSQEDDLQERREIVRLDEIEDRLECIAQRVTGVASRAPRRRNQFLHCKCSPSTAHAGIETTPPRIDGPKAYSLTKHRRGLNHEVITHNHTIMDLPQGPQAIILTASISILVPGRRRWHLLH